MRIDLDELLEEVKGDLIEFTDKEDGLSCYDANSTDKILTKLFDIIEKLNDN